jgi:heavy metal sensor kinase
MKKLSIGFRLTLWYLAIFALGEIIFAGGMYLILRHNLYDLVDDSLESQVDDLKNFLAAQPAALETAKLRQAVNETYSIQHPGDYFALYDSDGESLYHSNSLQGLDSLLIPAEQVKRPDSESRRIDNRPFRFLFQKLTVNGRVFTVEMGIPADDAVDTLQLFRRYLLMFAPGLLILAAGVGYWMSRKALSPVDELVRTAREVSGTNLSLRLQKLDTGDELARLSDTLNEMLDRIEVAFHRITEFTADASHELRTPVSLIRTEAELALRRSRGEAEYKESLRHILLEAERTTGLIEQLLSLARADSGREILELKPVDLRPLLKRIVEGWQQVAAIRGLHLSSQIDEEHGFVSGDETLLRRLTDILLDNAIKYTPAHGSVNVTLDSRGDKLIVTVQDTGIGIAKEEHPKIFERFYRVDKARTRAQGGAGLGLSIAEWIVVQHHGSIGVESSPGEGSSFRVELPMIAVPLANPQPA